MLQAIGGIYRDGKVELVEKPAGLDGSRVVVTFLAGSNAINLADRGVDPARANDLRSRLATMAEDWERPEMDIYDED